jgi:hypothetical protein
MRQNSQAHFVSLAGNRMALIQREFPACEGGGIYEKR